MFATHTNLYWSRIVGNGTLGKPQLIGSFPAPAPGHEPLYLRLADYDRNGRTDVAVAGDNGLTSRWSAKH